MASVPQDRRETSDAAIMGEWLECALKHAYLNHELKLDLYVALGFLTPTEIEFVEPLAEKHLCRLMREIGHDPDRSLRATYDNLRARTKEVAAQAANGNDPDLMVKKYYEAIRKHCNQIAADLDRQL